MFVIEQALVRLLLGGLGYLVASVGSVCNRTGFSSTPLRRTRISCSEYRSVSVIGQALVQLLLGGLGYLVPSIGQCQ